MLKFIFFLSCVVHCIICYDISKLTTPQIAAALAPIWDDRTHRLYFVNLLSQGEQASIYSYDNGILYGAYIERVSAPSFIMPIENKHSKKCKKREKCTNDNCDRNECDEQLFAVGVDHDVLIIQWNGKSTKARIVGKLLSLESNIPLSRTNIAIADRNGRLYGGTFTRTFCNANATSGFYRYSQTKGVDLLFNGVVSTTGIVFDNKAHKMYHLDTCTLLITSFDWDPKTGDICNGRVVFDFKTLGKPPGSFIVIGLEIDSNGNLYTADYYGAVWKINPMTSGVMDVIDLPKPGVNGIALGGGDGNTLYVVAGSTIIDPFSGNIVQQITDTTSLYAIRGLDSTATRPTRLRIKSHIKLMQTSHETC